MPKDSCYSNGNVPVWPISSASSAQRKHFQHDTADSQPRSITPYSSLQSQSPLLEPRVYAKYTDSGSYEASLPGPDGAEDPSYLSHNRYHYSNGSLNSALPQIPLYNPSSPIDDRYLHPGRDTRGTHDEERERGDPWNSVGSALPLGALASHNAPQYPTVTEKAPFGSNLNHLPTPPYPADAEDSKTTSSQRLESLPNYTWKQLCQGRRNRQSPTPDQFSTAIRDDQTDISKFGPMDKAFIDHGRSHLARCHDDVLTAAIVQHTERRSRLISALDRSILTGRPLQSFEGGMVPFGLDAFSYVAGGAHLGERVQLSTFVNDPGVGVEYAESFWKRLEKERREMCRRAV